MVHEKARGKRLGKKIVTTLMALGKQLGCYKVVLDCSQDNVPFYEKCGFTPKEHQMAWYVKK